MGVVRICACCLPERKHSDERFCFLFSKQPNECMSYSGRRALKGLLLENSGLLLVFEETLGGSLPFHHVAAHPGGLCPHPEKILHYLFFSCFLPSVFCALFLIILLVGCRTSQIEPLFILCSDIFHVCVFKSNFWSIPLMSNTPIDVKKKWLSCYLYPPFPPCFKALSGV